MTRVTVETGPRLHFGFGNLSVAHDRIYGAAGVALVAPTTRVSAERADRIDCDTAPFDSYAERVCDLLDLPGVAIEVESRLPRHVGLGSGTRAALATLTATAQVYDREPRVRERAPALGRGGRSGVGVATFTDGGIVVDGGHPTDRFTADRPADGDWTVPPVIARHDVPDDWRFLLVTPDVSAGQAGEREDESVRETITAASPEPADRIAGVVVRQLLPAAATGARERFGDAVSAIDRANGAWFADSQGGRYRPPVGRVVDELTAEAVVGGVGQSSWGPTVYAVTDADRADRAREAGRDALAAADVGGTVSCVAGDNRGVRVHRE